MEVIIKKGEKLKFIKEYPYFYLFEDENGVKQTKLKCDYVGEEIKKSPKNKWEQNREYKY